MVSDITLKDLQNYLREDELSEQDSIFLQGCAKAATEYIKKYTGVDDLDTHEDFDIAFYVIVQDMWDNRSLYADSTNPNKTVEAILNLHSVNLL